MFMNLLSKESAGSNCRFLCLIACFGVSLSPSVAHAGFNWTPPAAPAKQQQAPVVQDAAPLNGPLTPEPDALPVPVTHVEAAPVEDTEPLIVENTKPIAAPTPITRPAPTPVAKPAPAPVAEKMEELPAPTPAPEPAQMAEATPPAALPAPAPKPAPAPVAATPSSADIIEGFGKDIPLVIALRDIVPSKYAYAFSPNNIAGTKISWRGGKAWQDVLADALAPVGLEMSVRENTILIYSRQQSAPSPVSDSPAPSAAPATAAVSAPEPKSSPSATMVAKRPVDAPAANDAPLPLLSSQDAQSQEAAIKPTASAPTAAPSRPVMTAMDLKATRKWQARPGTTLRQTLETWAKESNVELNWSTPYDYPINNAFYFDGDFSQAVDSLLSSYGGENPNPKGRLYPNLPEGPSVLMVN